MKNAIFVFILLLFSANIFSQKQRHAIDSLQKKLVTVSSDTDRINIFIQLATYYYSIKADTFFLYCKKGIDLAKSLNRKKEMQILSLKMAGMLTDTGNYPLAFKYAEQSLSIARELNSKPMLINSYAEIGRAYDFQSDFVKSNDFFFKAMEIAKEINDHQKIALLGTNIAADFLNEGNYKKAEEYSLITLKEAQIANAPIHIYKAYYILGMIKASTKDSAAASDYYLKAIDICRQKSFLLNEAEVINDLAAVQATNEKRLDLLMQARKIYDSVGPSSFDSRINWQSLGDAYISLYKTHPERKELLAKAEHWLSLFQKKSQEVNDVMSVEQSLRSLSELSALKGDYKNAYELNIQYRIINDSIFSQENKNKIAGLESRNEIEKKNLEIEKQKLQVSEQRKNIFILLGGILLMGAIGFLFYRVSAIRKQKNEQLIKLNKELDDANKLKSKFFGILSHDLRSPIANLVNFLNLRKIKPGALSKEQAEERENKISNSAQSLLETMESMLLWSKDQMQQFRPEKKPIQIDHLFAYIKKTFSNYENISFEFSIGDESSINTDANYLRTIMHNLTSNAIKALADKPAGKIAWKAWKQNNKSVLSISDNGPGIDDEKIKTLYDDTTVGSTSQGLGLHIIRDLAKAINCNISSESKLNEGTTFILTFG